jgi:hypothetical protein
VREALPPPLLTTAAASADTTAAATTVKAAGACGDLCLVVRDGSSRLVYLVAYGLVVRIAAAATTVKAAGMW